MANSTVIEDKEKNLSETMGMLCGKTSQFYAKHKTFFPYTVLLNLIKRPTPQKSENMDIMYHIHVHRNLKLNSMQTVMLFAKSLQTIQPQNSQNKTLSVVSSEIRAANKTENRNKINTRKRLVKE